MLKVGTELYLKHISTGRRKHIRAHMKKYQHLQLTYHEQKNIYLLLAKNDWAPNSLSR